LHNPARQRWWDGLMTGDPEGYVTGLRGAISGPALSPAYFTGDATQYLAGLKNGIAKYGDLAQKYGAGGSGPGPISGGTAPDRAGTIEFPNTSIRQTSSLGPKLAVGGVLAGIIGFVAWLSKR
jgi:hypothetical protein